MPYPNGIDSFTNKLNKNADGYAIEEELIISDGVFEGLLSHDNINKDSIQVYTGSKFTGDKIKNFIISIPSETPWKVIIKVFSNTPKVYVTYETTGDQVEADDINQLQDSVINTQSEVERYKGFNDGRAADREVRILNVENNKAEKTYTDTELNKRYLKTETYNKTETDQRIQMVIDAAPDALNTLKEIADSLNNDPNFAATITTQLAGKVDKVEGKQLSTEDYTTVEKNKLAGVQENANNYIHPATHPASIITGLPTTLPANGGNADKLGNQSSSYYTNIKARLGYTPANIAGDTFKGNIKIQQLAGDLVAALVTEVNGQLIDFGTNFKQSDSKDTTKDGGLFRIDVRDGYPLFNVLYQPAGGAAEQALFSVDKDGTIYQGNKAHKIWHEGNDGSGSGLDADKVDGKDASAFADASHTHDDRYFMYKNLTKSDGTITAIGAADLNTITGTGFYFKNATANLNQPISNWGTLLVYKYDPTRIVQIFIPDNISTIYVRPYDDAWLEWREMNGGGGVVGPVTWNNLKGV